MPKFKGHIATGQYEFLEVELEGTAEEAVVAYRELQDEYNNETELPSKEWNTWLDNFLKGKVGTADQWGRMSFIQKKVIDEIRKSLKRTN